MYHIMFTLTTGGLVHRERTGYPSIVPFLRCVSMAHPIVQTPHSPPLPLLHPRAQRLFWLPHFPSTDYYFSIDFHELFIFCFTFFLWLPTFPFTYSCIYPHPHLCRSHYLFFPPSSSLMVVSYFVVRVHKESSFIPIGLFFLYVFSFIAKSLCSVLVDTPFAFWIFALKPAGKKIIGPSSRTIRKLGTRH